MRVVERALRQAVQRPARVLEIGCGPGIVLRHLRSVGIDCWGCELGQPPLPAPIAPFVFTGRNCLHLEREFRESIEVLLLLDVLEHIRDDAEFLREVRMAYPNARTLLVTVPARRELWSNYDVHCGHFRRYDRPAVAAMMANAGYRLVR